MRTSWSSLASFSSRQSTLSARFLIRCGRRGPEALQSSVYSDASHMQSLPPQALADGAREQAEGGGLLRARSMARAACCCCLPRARRSPSQGVSIPSQRAYKAEPHPRNPAAAATGGGEPANADGAASSGSGAPPLLAQLLAVDRELWELRRVAALRSADGGDGKAEDGAEVRQARPPAQRRPFVDPCTASACARPVRRTPSLQ